MNLVRIINDSSKYNNKLTIFIKIKKKIYKFRLLENNNKILRFCNKNWFENLNISINQIILIQKVFRGFTEIKIFKFIKYISVSNYKNNIISNENLNKILINLNKNELIKIINKINPGKIIYNYEEYIRKYLNINSRKPIKGDIKININ